MLKSGTTIYDNGLRFTFESKGKQMYVKVYDTERTLNSVSVFIPANAINTKQDLEEAVAWWLYDNGALH